MKSLNLLPHRFKLLGWSLFIAAFASLIYMNLIHAWTNEGNRLEIAELTWAYPENFSYANTNLTNVLLSSLLFIGLLTVCFVQEKNEDEYIAHLRLKSWHSAVLISYILLFIANWLLYGLEFLEFLILNVLTTPVVFILRFNYAIYELNKEGLSSDK